MKISASVEKSYDFWAESPQAWKRYIPFRKHSQAKKKCTVFISDSGIRHYACRTASVERTVVLSLTMVAHQHFEKFYIFIFSKISFSGVRGKQPLTSCQRSLTGKRCTFSTFATFCLPLFSTFLMQCVYSFYDRRFAISLAMPILAVSSITGKCIESFCCFFNYDKGYVSKTIYAFLLFGDSEFFSIS